MIKLLTLTVSIITCSCLFVGVSVAEELKAALLTQGSATESGWNRIAYNALKLIESDLGATVSNVELDANPATFEKAFEDYANSGFSIIIGHGFQFEDAAREVAGYYPDVTFLITSSVAFDGNVVGVNLDSYQPFFLMGVIAAKRTDRVGYIGGVEIPPITQAAIGFRNGARYVNPDIKVSEVMIGSWNDLAAAKEAALAMIGNGVEMIVPNANVSALGVFQAIQEAGDTYSSFGAFGDYTKNAPQNILGNYMPDLGQGFLSIASQIKDGTFAPEGNIVFGLESEDIVITKYNDDAAHPVSSALRAELQEIKKMLISGEIDPTVDLW